MVPFGEVCMEGLSRDKGQTAIELLSSRCFEMPMVEVETAAVAF